MSGAAAATGVVGSFTGAIDPDYLAAFVFYMTAAVLGVGILSMLIIPKSHRKQWPLALAVFTLFLTWYGRGFREASELREHGTTTRAVISDIRTQKHQWQVLYTYHVDGETYRAWLYRQNFPGNIRMGDSITVRYSINCPRLNEVAGW